MIRTRIAPSPTGQDLHVGSIATALVNFAWAKKHNGQFVVRIEDTDRTRYVEGAEERILNTLELVGIIPDESPRVGGPYGPYRQSDRIEIYQRYAHELVKKGAAYYCTCSKERLDEVRKKQMLEKKPPRYDRHCRSLDLKYEDVKDKSFVVRLKIPDNQEIVVHDLIRGDVKFNTNDIDDQVLLKSDGYPTYHLAVVIDDHLMKISHVIRAEEWLPSTPKHILLYQAFGWDLPQFAHLPLLRNPDRSKLSKRKNPVWASWYLEQGFLPEVLVNYLALMGWSHPEQKEIFSLDEYIKVFDLKDIQKTAPIFDPVKLEWMNGEYVRNSQRSKVKSQILEYYKKYHNKDLPEEMVEKTLPLVQERIKKLADYWEYCQFFYERPKSYEVDLKDKKELFKKIYQRLKKINEFNAFKIGEEMMQLVKEENLKTGKFFMDLRVAITGKKISPPLNESMEILGKGECLERIKTLI
ncbi:MAG: glutamate--tRNA ligase [Patescibacteria group bacterium]|nr:MAG: glutamate--tRNA ligase [Patescibacteria group bacterium]